MNNLQDAVESLAQAWVAASTRTGVNSSNQDSPPDKTSLPSMIPEKKAKKEAPASTATLSSATVSTTALKSTPIRCVVEVVNRDTGVLKQETDNYAIVPSQSLFKDVVKTVLLKLGHTSQDALAAKGTVQIKNWKPLELATITDNSESTVEDILGDLTSVATLKIRITSRALSEDLKDKLLHLLLTQSQDILHKAGCPISKNDLEKLVSGSGELSSDMKSSFYNWYQQHTTSLFQTPAPFVSSTATTTPSPAKSRLRISFDAEQEVPRLMKWFAESAHPSRHQMIKYLEELNSLSCRKSGKPLDLTNIMYWFKNARAAARRNGRSTAGEESMSDDECRVPEPSATPVLPNKNAVYLVKDPLIPNEAPDSGDKLPDDGNNSEDSEMEDDVSITDDESDDESSAQDLSVQKNGCDISPTQVKREAGEVQTTVAGSRSSSTSSTSPNPKPASIYNTMLSGYPFPFGPMPMAYLQSHMNPFYKDMSEKVQSAVAQAHATSMHHSASMVPTIHKSKSGERQKRHRAFIDPVSEIPKLEQWFIKDTHPSHYVIEQICDELNRGEFRSRYPKLSPKNIQLWFKNHRAKVKRMRVTQHLPPNLSSPGLHSPPMVHN